MLSVIIPALDEATGIGPVVRAISALAPNLDVIVVDGGSRDGTIEEARRAGAQIVATAPGRGSQMHAGALHAHGEVLWFVHADTLPHPGAVDDIDAALQAPAVVAGNFRLRFDGNTTGAQLLNRLQGLRALLGWHYGDNTIFVRSDVYRASGGFRPYPLFEDADLIKRLRQAGRFVTLPGPVVSSSRRFENGRFLTTSLLWFTLQLLYWIGLPPGVLARFYPQIRRSANSATDR